MKNINCLFVAIFIIFFSSTKAQSISGIVLSVDTSTCSGTCPHKIKFNAVINYSGQLKTANLIWDKDGTTVTVNNVGLSGKGNDRVSYEWLVHSNFNGTMALHINTSNVQKSSNTIHFKSKCK